MNKIDKLIAFKISDKLELADAINWCKACKHIYRLILANNNQLLFQKRYSKEFHIKNPRMSYAPLFVSSHVSEEIYNKDDKEIFIFLYSLQVLAEKIPELAGLSYEGMLVKSGLYSPPKLGNLTESVFKKICFLSNLETLRLINCGIKSLPSELFKLINLKDVSFKNNQITEIPKEIGKLTKLENLILSNNQISEIPAEIGNLINLDNLVLTNNQISEIPKEIGNLIDLNDLDLLGNLISEIPQEILNLKELTGLYIGNNIRSFPSFLYPLPLFILEIGNKIELPEAEEILRFSHLQEVKINGRFVRYIPFFEELIDAKDALIQCA